MVTERSDGLTVVIATRNRAAFLIPLLEYYAGSGLQAQVVIGDSSEEDQIKSIQAALGRVEDRLHIRYHRYPTYADRAPGMGFIHCVSDLIQHHVTTTYVVVAADDDFLIPAALAQAVDFMEDHPDYSAVHGKTLLGILADGAEVELVGTEFHLQRSITDSLATERLRNHLTCGAATEYSVKRTVQTVAHWEASLAVVEEQFLGELLRSCLSVIDGKVHQLDRLYMVRRGHRRMTSRRSDDCFDQLVHPVWPRQYARFRDSLAEALCLKDEVTLAEAREIIKETFWAYLAKQIVRQWQVRYARRNGQVAWRARLREIPWLRQMYREVFSRLPGEAHAMSLSALLRRSSPYHRDFLPIYQTITKPHASIN